MLAKRSVKNQITLPKEVLTGFPGVEYFEVYARGDEIVLRPVSMVGSRERLLRVRAKIKALGLSEKDVLDAVRWARKGA